MHIAEMVLNSKPVLPSIQRTLKIKRDYIMSRWPDFKCEDEMLAYLNANNQCHLSAHYRALPTNADRATFTTSLLGCPPLDIYKSIFDESMKCFLSGPSGVITPPSNSELALVTPSLLLGGKDGGTAVVSPSTVEQKELTSDGIEAVWRGEVAVLVLAGGSGTRLGYEHPKGMFVSPRLSSQASLFEVQCRRIRSLEIISAVKAGVSNPQTSSIGKVHVVLMTSLQTDSETRDYFRTNNYFGLQTSQVHFFLQSSMPCSTEEGKILLESPTTISMAPGGNAGIYQGLATAVHASSGAELRLSDTPDALLLRDFLAAKQGVKFVQIFTVDNILAKMGDPYFTGYAAKHGCDVVVKATPKVEDHEKVGVFAKRDGKWGVVEYTEIGKERAEMRILPDGRLAARESLSPSECETSRRAFDAGNIAIHLCSVPFLLEVGERMNTYTYYHVAKKQIKAWSPQEKSVSAIAGVKLEAFIFDLFEFVEASKFAILSVDRREEFFPIKNFAGRDSPETAASAYQGLHFNWLLGCVSPKTKDDLITATQAYLAAIGDGNATSDSDDFFTASGIVECAPYLLYGWGAMMMNSYNTISPSSDSSSILLDLCPRSTWDLIGAHVVRALQSSTATSSSGGEATPEVSGSPKPVAYIDSECLKALTSTL